MNANEIAPKANVRLSRIKKISRALKILFLLYPLLYFTGGWNLPFIHQMPDGLWIVFGTYTTFSDAPFVAKLIVVLAAGAFLAALITCYQLLNLYERGIIFSARNVQFLGRIGQLAFGYGVFKVFAPAAVSAWLAWIGSPSSTLLWLTNWILWRIPMSLCSPWIIGGLFVVAVSYIMDEGRKIQEEQELTV